MTWVFVFIMSAITDVGAVLFTRSVQMNSIRWGTPVTGLIALANWGSTLAVVKLDNDAIWPSVAGHMAGFVIGMCLPMGAASRTERPSKD